MIRPVNFGFNTETAVNNAFQVAGNDTQTQQKAAQEFDALVTKLRSKKIEVLVLEDTPFPFTPDSIFPNNWISFHPGHTICLYPMFANNRRMERKPAVLKQLKEHFNIQQTINFTHYEEQSMFLEGTGSLVLDRDNRIAYACLSDRTHIEVLDAFCRKMQYLPVAFNATDQNGDPIYHTNVMMSVADRYAVVCLDSIKSRSEKKNVKDAIALSNKELISISYDQMNHFAGNMLQVKNKRGKKFLVMSTQALQSLTTLQKAQLAMYNDIIDSPLDTIESNGGGSARCMIAEVF